MTILPVLIVMVTIEGLGCPQRVCAHCYCDGYRDFCRENCQDIRRSICSDDMKRMLIDTLETEKVRRLN
jgi:hypothetical protein